jgi:hypothetical protein
MISPSNQVGGALPGLTLKAWAHISAGVLVRGFNVTSATKPGAGESVITFTAAMSAANYVVRATGVPTDPTAFINYQFATNAKVVGSMTLRSYVNGALADVAGVLVEIYE